MRIPRTPKTPIERQIKGMNYAVKNRKGSINHLKAQCGKDVLNGLLADGFIQNFSPAKAPKRYQITKKGDRYYKEKFGLIEYYKARLLGIFEKIMGKI